MANRIWPIDFATAFTVEDGYSAGYSNPEEKEARGRRRSRKRPPPFLRSLSRHFAKSEHERPFLDFRAIHYTDFWAFRVAELLDCRTYKLMTF